MRSHSTRGAGRPRPRTAEPRSSGGHRRMAALSRNPRWPHRHDACPWDLWRVSYRARLTLFAMVYALANGVPPAGVAFAAAMLLGVALTPCVCIFAREWRVRSWTRHGATLAHLSRLLEGAKGVALLLIGLAPFVSVI
jgi:hypothetical protein